MVGWEYFGPFDELDAQLELEATLCKRKIKRKCKNAISCHKVIDGGKDNIGNDVVVNAEGIRIVHIATGCGSIDNKIGKKNNLVEIAPL